MLKAAPPSSFKVAQPQLLFQLLIVAFDAPAEFGLPDQRAQGTILWQRAQPVLAWFRLVVRPLDEEPFFRTDLPAPVIAMRSPHPHASEPRMQGPHAAFPPSDRAPSGGGQAERHLLDRNRLVLLVAAQQFGGPTRAPVFLGRQRTASFRPDRRLRLDAHGIAQPERREFVAKGSVVAVRHIRHHGAARYSLHKRLPHLL